MDMIDSLERRIAKLESLLLENRLSAIEEAVDKEAAVEEFTKICKSCNLPEPIVKGNKAISEFKMGIFYRRIQKRMRIASALKYYQDDDVKLTYNINDGSLFIDFLGDSKPVLDDLTPVKFKFRDRILSLIGPVIDDILRMHNELYRSYGVK